MLTRPGRAGALRADRGPRARVEPAAHNPGPLLHALIARPFAPAEERLRQPRRPAGGRTRRARHRPRDAARLPRIHAGDGGRPVRRHRGAGPRRAAGAARRGARAARHGSSRRRGGGRARSTSSPTGCARGCATARPGRDPRLGRRLWEARLWHTLDTELGAAEVLRRRRGQPRPGHRGAPGGGRRAGRRPGRRRDGAAGAGPARRRAPGQRHDRGPGQGDPGEATEFVRDARAGHPGRRPVRDHGDAGVRPGVAVAYCDPPGPLETADVPTFYCIAPDPGGLVGGAGRVVLPRVQRPHAPEPDGARGDAGALPAAGARPPVPRAAPGPGRWAAPGRSSRAGRSTPRS